MTPRQAGIAFLAGLVLAIGALGCPAPKPAVCPDRADAVETEDEKAAAKGLDACARAAANLARMSCPEASPHFAEKCRYLVDHGQPICPVRLARAKSCGEAAEVCR